MVSPGKIFFALVAICSLAVELPRVASAQPPAQHNISIDSSFGSPQTLTGPNYTIGANLGKQVGSNLFHSFGIFGLATGESATFSGPATVSNVIGRVTGGNLSSVNGSINSTIAGANLYLINPSGIVFGPNATVNVSGSFHASTGDYLKMSDGAKFQATKPDGSTLSAAPPAAFGFLTASPAAITVNGSTLGPVPGTLGLVGGPVSVTGGTLSAPAGTIHVASAAGTGEVPVDPRNTTALTPPVTSFGQVQITRGSTLDVSDPTGLGSGGSVFIRSGALMIDASTIAASNNGSGPGGQIVLRGDNQVMLSNNAMVQAFTLGSGSGAAVSISTAPSGIVVVDASTVSSLAASTAANAGPGGTISIVAGELDLHNGANVLAASCLTPTCGTPPPGTLPPVGAGGTVSVSVGGALTIDTGASLGTVARGTGNAGNVSVMAGPVTIDMSVGAGPSILHGISSMTNRGSTGNAGTISVSAPSVSIVNNGAISTSTSGPGAAGSVSVSVAGGLTIDGSRASPTSLTGITSIANSGNTGNAGTVTVSAGNVSIANNGVIVSATVGSGKGGSVSVAVAGQLSLDGALGNPSSLTGISSQSQGRGDAGTVTVTAGALSIANSSTIASNTFGPGRGGSISVTVDGQLTIDGMGAPANLQTGIAANSEAGSTGNAGGVTVEAGALSIANGGSISSSALRPSGNLAASTGNAGSVTVDVAGLLSIGGSGGGFGSRIATSVNPGTIGNAGSVAVTASQITIASGAEIVSTTAGTGAGGSVSVTTPGALVLDGAGVANTQIAASATGPQSGPGGSVTVSAGTLTVKGGAQIASSTAGPGKGGNVNITVASDIVLPDPGPQITAQSTGSGDAGSITVSAVRLLMNTGASILTEAATSTASGGNIILQLRDFLYLVSSEISTSVKGETGSGGNIRIDPQLVILDHSSIIAQAIEGHGGNITITADLFVPSSDSVVSASSELGISGAVVINGPRVDVNGALVVLSTQLRGRTEVLREACAARADRPISSLVEAGRGGLPQDPEATLPALYIAGRDIKPEPGTDTVEPSGGTPLHTTARLTMRCS